MSDEQLMLEEDVENDARGVQQNYETEEAVEEVNVIDLIQEEVGRKLNEVVNAQETQIAEAAVEIAKPVKQILNRGLIIVAVTFVIAIAALIFSIAKTDLTIGQGELFVESGIVNEMLGNLIRNDLAAKIPDEINIRDISIRVVLYGHDAENYYRVSHISDSDSVSAEIVFFPQESVEAFARNCRAMLDVMAEQSVVYDKISFVGEDRRTIIHADLSGRFSLGLSVEEIMDITFYFGEIDNE
jgi:hypothetical protein